MNYNVKDMDPAVVEILEECIDEIDNNELDDVIWCALIDGELSERQFKELVNILDSIDVPIKRARNKYFENLFNQYMESASYEEGEVIYLEDIADTMSTAKFLGMDMPEVTEIVKRYHNTHMDQFDYFPLFSLREFKIKFLQDSEVTY